MKPNTKNGISISPTEAGDLFWRKTKPLPLSTLTAPAPALARKLLGKVIVTDIDNQVTAGIITEVEAYLGDADPASHAYRGLTKRNKAMFEVGGTCYVYLSYGTHYCFNVVSGKSGHGQAVLIRAFQPIYNLTTMAKRRGIKLRKGKYPPKNLSDGPGKASQALGINLSHYGEDFRGQTLKIVNLGIVIPPASIKVTGRIGISRGEDLPLRFLAAESDEWVPSLNLVQC